MKASPLPDGSVEVESWERQTVQILDKRLGRRADDTIAVTEGCSGNRSKGPRPAVKLEKREKLGKTLISLAAQDHIDERKLGESFLVYDRRLGTAEYDEGIGQALSEFGCSPYRKRITAADRTESNDVSCDKRGVLYDKREKVGKFLRLALTSTNHEGDKQLVKVDDVYSVSVCQQRCGNAENP
jgi:hypothetical protein